MNDFAALRAQMSPLPGTRLTAPDGREFPWGPVQAIHAVESLGIEVVEYLADNSRISNPSENTVRHHGATRFHPYIEGRSTSTSYLRLDSAIVGAITQQRAGCNSQAAAHFDLMTLGVLPDLA